MGKFLVVVWLWMLNEWKHFARFIVHGVPGQWRCIILEREKSNVAFVPSIYFVCLFFLWAMGTLGFIAFSVNFPLGRLSNCVHNIHLFILPLFGHGNTIADIVTNWMNEIEMNAAAKQPKQWEMERKKLIFLFLNEFDQLSIQYFWSTEWEHKADGSKWIQTIRAANHEPASSCFGFLFLLVNARESYEIRESLFRPSANCINGSLHRFKWFVCFVLLFFFYFDFASPHFTYEKYKNVDLLYFAAAATAADAATVAFSLISHSKWMVWSLR